MIEEEKYEHSTIPKLIDNNPDTFRLTMIAQIRESIGTFGTERVRLLKNAFKVIIDNVIPLGVKSYLALFNQDDPSKLVKNYKQK